MESEQKALYNKLVENGNNEAANEILKVYPNFKESPKKEKKEKKE
tara:strand:- start:1164 stop:1298 length:135 start_codon:yes stop_codon:yes gene_type:complete